LSKESGFTIVITGTDDMFRREQGHTTNSHTDDSVSPVQKHYDTIISQFDDISQEEKRDLIEQIEGVVSKDSIAATSRLIAFKPKNRGVFFPVLINTSALLLIAFVVFLSALYFRVKHTEMSLETDTFLSTEKRIIEEYREESEQKLRQKDNQIVKIQAEVEELDKQIEELKSIMQASIATREQELRRTMEEALESEQARLRAQGLSEEQIKVRIAELEKRMSSEYTRQLEQYRIESEATFREREEQLLKEKEKAEQRLENATREKEQVLQEAKRRESELREKYDLEKDKLRAKTSEAEQRFKVISELREKEQLIADQILGSYAVIIAKIEREDFEGAYRDIANLRELLLNESLDYMPTVVKRRKIELFMVDLLEDRIEAKLFGTGKETISEEDMVSLREAANLLLKISQIVSKADEAYQKGNIEEAERLYTIAVGELPAVSKASHSLDTIEGSRERSILRGHLDRAEDLAQRGVYDEAISQYRKGALDISGDNRELILALLDGLTRSLSRLETDRLAEKEQTLERRIEEARKEGWQSALYETLRLLTYLTALNTGETVTYDPELERQAEKDPLFKTVFEKVQLLLETGRAQEAPLSGDFGLMGILATVSGDEAVIEPLVKIPVEENALLWIRRRSRTGIDISIAQAVVRQVSERRITARIEKIFVEGQTPRVTDLVYIKQR
jgi:uncharacterized protein YdcH (DUF465 family)